MRRLHIQFESDQSAIAWSLHRPAYLCAHFWLAADARLWPDADLQAGDLPLGVAERLKQTADGHAGHWAPKLRDPLRFLNPAVSERSFDRLPRGLIPREKQLNLFAGEFDLVKGLSRQC